MRALLTASIASIALGASAPAQLGGHPSIPAQKSPLRSGAKPRSTSGTALPPTSASSALVGGADDCATPEAAAVGPISFDTTAATTGAQGQSEAGCLFAGTSGIARDVWFTFVATATGVATATTCGSATFDTKLAAYAGSACPSASALACSDDACALQSTITFAVTAGASYVLQLGSYPGSSAGVGTIALGITPAASNDDCAAAIALAGAGPHAFDNGPASAGTQGQNESACLYLGTTGIAHDVWFTWTAEQTGFHELSFCGGTNIDTKIAVYAGAGCPTGAALACNEDRCGLQSSLCFVATNGATYTLQVGTYPNAAGGTGTFTIQPSGGTTNDDCSNAALVSGFGPFAFDATSATTSCQGQSNATCNFYGQPGIARDLWFRWTAPSNGNYQVSLCGTSAGVDTKVAVYAGAGCPSAAALACDDDGCASFAGEARACFAASAGATYTFQIGSYPGAPPAVGSFAVLSAPPALGCRYDDAGSENAIGYQGGGAIVWFHRFGGVGQTGSIASVSAAFGTPQFPGFAPPVGTPIVAAVWEDPNDDGNPSDAVLLRQVSGVVGHIDVDVLDEYAFTPAVSTSGTWFAGVSIAHGGGQFPAALDQTSCPSSSNGRAWIAAAPSGAIDLSNLALNAIPPTQTDALGLPGVWLVRSNCTLTLGTSYCFGDGTGGACPCGNFGGLGHGCANSIDPTGALLRSTGVASLAGDTATLLCSGMAPTGTCLYFQGTTQVSTAFGDGLRCVGGAIVRLGLEVNSGGMSQFPGPGDPTISARCAAYSPPQPLSAGALRHYQTWYRNAASFCTPATFNLANGISITWTP